MGNGAALCPVDAIARAGVLFAVLLMPEGQEPAQERITEEVDRLFDSLEAAGVWWPDPRPANVLSYQGRVVACDFGRADA
jgi:hypothetical protein